MLINSLIIGDIDNLLINSAEADDYDLACSVRIWNVYKRCTNLTMRFDSDLVVKFVLFLLALPVSVITGEMTFFFFFHYD